MGSDEQNYGFWLTFAEEFKTLSDVFSDCNFNAMLAILIRVVEIALGHEMHWRPSIHLDWVKLLVTLVAQTFW